MRIGLLVLINLGFKPCDFRNNAVDGLAELPQPALAGYKAGRPAQRPEPDNAAGLIQPTVQRDKSELIAQPPGQLDRRIKTFDNERPAEQIPDKLRVLAVEFHELDKPAFNGC